VVALCPIKASTLSTAGISMQIHLMPKHHFTPPRPLGASHF